MASYKLDDLQMQKSVRESSGGSGLVSFLLHKSAQYPGPPSLSPHASKFSSFTKDPIYSFPVINSSLSTDFPGGNSAKSSIGILADFDRIDIEKLRPILLQLHENSPFRRGSGQALGDSTLSTSEHLGHLNSVNSDGSQDIDIASFHRPQVEASKELADTSMSNSTARDLRTSRPEMSQMDKELILNIQKRFASEQEDERMLHSMTPASSAFSDFDEEIETDALGKPCEMIFDPNGSLMKDEAGKEDSLSSLAQLHISQSPESHQICELVPEIDGEESNAFYRSTEAIRKAKIAGIYKSTDDEFSGSSADEGIPSMPTVHFFRDGETASKNVLTRTRQQVTFFPIEPKILQSTTFLSTITESYESPQAFSAIECPDSLSPIYRKLAICEENPLSPRKENHSKTAELVGTWPCCGFTTTPGLLFSNIENKSKGTVSNNGKAVLGFLTIPIIRKFTEIQVAWVTCGFEHCGLISGEGRVYTWGYGASGCLGHGDTNSHSIPRIVEALAHVSILYMEAGAYHNAAVSDKGELWTWGRADVHQLGLPFKRLFKDDIGYVAFSPIKVDEFAKRRKTIKAVACGEAHTLVLDSEGTVYSFGWAEDGQLGLPPDHLKDGQMSTEIEDLPTLRRERIIKVAAGALFSVCVTNEGNLYIWGNGDQGQLGLGSLIKQRDLPTLQSQLSGECVLDVICGENSVICLTKSGRAYAWGQGVAGAFRGGQFPEGSEVICYAPRLLMTVDIAHHIVLDKPKDAKKKSELGFFQTLNSKLKLLQEQDDRSDTSL